MPTSTSRLGIPVPVSTDPANVPSDMLNLADALDGGSNANYDGAAVIISTPGAIGTLPVSPIVGTIFPVNSSPPYLLYYTGESTTPTGTAPVGWRLVGQAGSNVAVMSNTTPGNSASPGTQPVWAPLDHRHASLPWSSGQTTAIYTGVSASDGTANAYARADHSHGSAHQPAQTILYQASLVGPSTFNVFPNNTPVLIAQSGSFTIPSSTNVLVRCTFYGWIIANTASIASLVANAQSSALGTPQCYEPVAITSPNSSQTGGRCTYEAILTGIGTASASTTISIYTQTLSSGGGFVGIDSGSSPTSYGPFVMTITAL